MLRTVSIAHWITVLLVTSLAYLAGCQHVTAQTSRAARVGIKSFWGVKDPNLLRNLGVDVQQAWHASAEFPGFEDVETDEDQAEINHWNDVDMAPWLLRAPLSMDALLSLPFLEEAPICDTRRLVAIYNSTIYWLHQHWEPMKNNGSRLSLACEEPCNQEYYHWQMHMDEFLSGRRKVAFPNVVFYLSVNDFPSSTRMPAPVLSFQKRDGFDDILVPILHDMRHPLYIFPWKDKVDKGFMRATPYCQCGLAQPFVRCARSYFSMRSLYENMSHVLEAALTTGFGNVKDDVDPISLRRGPLPAVGEFPLRDHARYRYLLDTDGMTGSYRASKLMFFNSPIFKQQSPFYEWYTRSLQDGVHHIKFWITGPDDIYDIIEQHRHNESGLQAMSLTAMKFAYKYCTETPRKLYWRRALERYKTLFPGMDAWMGAYNWTVDAVQT